MYMFIAQYFATCVKGIANETIVKNNLPLDIPLWTSTHTYILYTKCKWRKSNNLQVDINNFKILTKKNSFIFLTCEKKKTMHCNGQLLCKLCKLLFHKVAYRSCHFVGCNEYWRLSWHIHYKCLKVSNTLYFFLTLYQITFQNKSFYRLPRCHCQDLHFHQ